MDNAWKRIDNLESLKGEVLTHIDIDEKEHQIMLTTESGRRILIYHSQNCCESVTIEGTDGEWKSLIGKVLIEATGEEDRSGNAQDGFMSWTRTFLTFKVDDATVINRWIGESNGYYSEFVDFKELKQ